MPLGQRSIGTASGPRVAPATVGPGGPVDIPSSQTVQAVADAGGTATITFHPEPQGSYAELEIVLVKSNSAATPVARVYVGSVADANERDFTPNGNEDIAFEQPPIYVPGGNAIVVQWTGCTAGATCTATVQYRLKG